VISVSSRSRKPRGIDVLGREVELICLTDEVDAETVMGALTGEFETGREVDLASSHERVIGPQHDPLIPRTAGELDAFIYEACTESQPASTRVNEQDPQLRRRAVFRYTEDAADAFTVTFCDPGGFPDGVVPGCVVGNDAGNERFEGAVPTELVCIDLAVCHDHPPEVAWFTERSNLHSAVSHHPHRRANWLKV
jgi:hypothetical protein